MVARAGDERNALVTGGSGSGGPIGVPFRPAVILSTAKDLFLGRAQILRCAQDDRWWAAPEASTSAREHRSFLAEGTVSGGDPCGRPRWA
ncbi:MAG: hypothetical protein E6I91_13400 [Chloroflexi bacterium]|nr:MAG: hypothetical protein E6I91_13400 [Chloroflexota bacterium]